MITYIRDNCGESQLDHTYVTAGSHTGLIVFSSLPQPVPAVSIFMVRLESLKSQIRGCGTVIKLLLSLSVVPATIIEGAELFNYSAPKTPSGGFFGSFYSVPLRNLIFVDPFRSPWVPGVPHRAGDWSGHVPGCDLSSL